MNYNNIILAVRNFKFIKIIILTFQSFTRREEKINEHIFFHIVMICIKKRHFLIILNFDVSIFSLNRRKNIQKQPPEVFYERRCS